MGRLPRFFFDSGEAGGYYDPANKQSLFQDDAATIPVRQPGDPVGCVLDGSGNAMHAKQSDAAKRPRYHARYNLLRGTDNVASGWWLKGSATWTYGHEDSQGGNTAARYLTPTTGPFYQSFTSTSTRLTYSIDVKYGGTGSSIMSLLLRNDTTVTNFIIGVFDTQAGQFTQQTAWQVTPLGNGWYRCSFTQESGIAIGNTMRAYCGSTGNIPDARSAYIARLSVVDAGNDPGLYQSVVSDTDYQILGRRYNWLQKTQDFSESVWFKGTGTWTHGHEDSQGGNTASRGETPTTGPFIQGFVATGESLIYQIDVKYGGVGSGIFIGLLRNGTTATNFGTSNFNTETGQFTIPTGWTSQSLGNGWYRLRFEQTSGITIGDSMLYYFGMASATNDVRSFFVCQPSITLSADEGRPYQWVYDKHDYDADTIFRPYLQFDGVDDFLLTPNMDLTGTNKITVFSRFTATDFTSAGIEMVGNHNGTAIPSFTMMARQSAGTAGFQAGVEILRSVPKPGLIAPDTSTWTGSFDGSITNIRLRKDGIQAGSGLSAPQSGAFVNVPLYMGAQTFGTIRFFSGKLYELAVRGVASTDHEVELAERLMTQWPRDTRGLLAVRKAHGASPIGIAP